mmetsp:Transcript_56532/g.175715  ORF Transcript_56532/g.175715 Transcript_56532/m.175715 type:complete len:94 (-) Transcript_56532:155-436(-)
MTPWTADCITLHTYAFSRPAHGFAFHACGASPGGLQMDPPFQEPIFLVLCTRGMVEVTSTESRVIFRLWSMALPLCLCSLGHDVLHQHRREVL